MLHLWQDGISTPIHTSIHITKALLYIKCFLGPVRPVLQPSTSLSVEYRTVAWFMTILAIFFAPLVLATSAYFFLLCPRLVTPIPLVTHASLPLALTVLSAYAILLSLLFGASKL